MAIYRKPFAFNSYIYKIHWYFFKLVVIFYIKLVVGDPGYLGKSQKNKNNKEKRLLQLLKVHESDDICPECMIKKPIRSRHCDIC